MPLIVIEGLDAAGKHTQSTILAHRIGARLYSFPQYETPTGRLIKRHLTGHVQLMEEHTIDSSDHTIDGTTTYRRSIHDAMMFQALMAVDKFSTMDRIQNQLRRGESVVCDRWIPSAICYGAADGVDPDWVERIHSGLPQANLNIFLDITPEEALRRRPDARDRYERDREKQQRVRANYQRLWSEGGSWYVTVDGDGGGSDQKAIDVVAERIWKAVTAVGIGARS